MSQYVFDEAARELTPLQNFTPDETFVPADHEISPIIEALHDYPRFGNPNDFEDLINSISSGGGDAAGQAAKEYAVGIFAGSILILSIAVLWFFVIAMLKIAGPNKVGFFAGRLIRPTSIDHAEAGVEVVMENDPGPIHNSSHVDHEQKSFGRRVIFVRIIFVACAILTIIASILFYTKGVAAFKESIDAMIRGIDLVQDLAYRTMNVTNNVVVGEKNLQDEVDPFIEAENAGNPICGTTADELSSQIREIWDGLVTGTQELTVLIDENLATVSEDLQTVIDMTEEVKNSVSAAEAVFVVLVIVSVFIIAVICLMLGGVAFSVAGISNAFTKCITAAVIWPIFTLLLVLSWILCTVFLIASLAGADFCIDPDAYVMQVVDQYKGKFDSAIFQFVLFYISGCTERPSGESALFGTLEVVRDINEQAHELSQIMGNIDLPRLATICGIETSEAGALQQLSNFLHDISHLLNRSFIGVMDLLSCKSFNPIYTTFVYDALCGGGVQGLSWIFFTMLTIALSCMMMITFRAALYPVNKETGALAKTANVDVMQYQQNMNEPQDGGGHDLHLQDEMKKSKDEADTAVQIY